MKTKRWWIVLFSILAVGSGAAAEEIAGLPVHVQKLTPATVRVWVGDTVSSTATVAFATQKGVVVVDTTGIPRVDAELRKVIARELGRKDFKVLINTHEHADHTGGNSVYSDCAIVAQELVPAGMALSEGDRQRSLDWNATRAGELKESLAKATAGTPEAKKLQEEAAINRLFAEVFQSNAKPAPPTTTFADRMTMRMGDTTFELYYIGGMHSASDIAVLVPERGLLLTGDTMADVWLTDTPGCLASFAARRGVAHDFPRMIGNWDRILAKKDRITQLVPGHWNGELTMKGCEDRVAYVKTLWGAVNASASGGGSLDELEQEYRLDKRFPDLAGSPGFSGRNNYTTILEMWDTVTGRESGADRLYRLIAAGAPEEEIRQLLAARDAKPAHYYFLEDQVNAYGYAFFQQDQMPQAIRMFKLYVELFPDSWNAYDSLGEAYLKAGDREAARAMYEKSVSLKPDSKTGLDALEKLKGEATEK
jgi:glyoxylase-like metal-dependent hydrolase (beta-lactamase superfamily II)